MQISTLEDVFIEMTNESGHWKDDNSPHTGRNERWAFLQDVVAQKIKSGVQPETPHEAVALLIISLGFLKHGMHEEVAPNDVHQSIGAAIRQIVHSFGYEISDTDLERMGV